MKRWRGEGGETSDKNSFSSGENTLSSSMYT